MQTKKGTSGKGKHIVLKLFDTNKYAPGPHPFTYGGQTRRQFVVSNKQAENILCYKFLNNYQLKSAAWVQSQAYKLRHHKNCNFDFFYISYDPKKLKTKHKWRGEWDSDTLSAKDDEREQEAEEEGDDKERKGEKAEAKKEKDGDKCGCCCHDGDNKKKSKADRSKDGEPDDEDDVIEVTPTKSKDPINSNTGGGGQPQPTPPVKPSPSGKTPTPPPTPPGKGELNDEYGFYVERPFYIVSSLCKDKYMDVVNSSVVLKTQNELDSQTWWFDQKTKTILNKGTLSKSLNIQSNGSSSNLQVYKTSGQWF